MNELTIQIPTTITSFSMDMEIETIKKLYEKYENDYFMQNKIRHYVCQQLPILLENVQNQKIQSMIRNEELTIEQDRFIHQFLNNCHYYYVQSTEKYFFYDGLHYQETTEDNVLYNILSTISQERNPLLMGWKHKTKISVLKKIKENPLQKSIPESETIQMVLDSLYPSFFSSKTEAKYFLTILGDNLLKKNTSSIHFISPLAKSFLREINTVSVFFFNTQCIQTFKYKCHEKHYEYENKDCRLLKILESIKSDNLWKKIIQSISLELLCVACHYSIRYGNSDKYMSEMSNDPELAHRVLRMKNTTPEELVDRFVKEYLFVVDGCGYSSVNTVNGNNTTNYLSSGQNSGMSSLASSPILSQMNERSIGMGGGIPMLNMPQITWKNMQYLWKQFLHRHDFPQNAYQPFFKMILTTQKLSRQDKTDADIFVGVGSSQLPIIQRFQQFWSENMVVDENETELEVEEITTLFRMWGDKVRVFKKESFSLNEMQIIDILTYFYPEIEIEKNKYISKYRCILWDKGMDIQIALQQMREEEIGIDLEERAEEDDNANQCMIMDIVGNMTDIVVETTTTTATKTSSPTPKPLLSISIYDAYLYYCKFYSMREDNPQIMTKHLLVSKSYFEQYVVKYYGFLASSSC
jgi:hypothetical protein